MAHFSSPIKTAVFPVGGIGTRFLPATKASPKEMLPVLDKPLIQYSVEEALKAGIEKFVFVTGRGKTAIEDHFDRDPALEAFLTAQGKEEFCHIIKDLSLDAGQVIYVRQPEPLGLGHAIHCAAPWIKEQAFAVLLPDDFIQADPGVLMQMCQVYDMAKRPVMAAVMTVPEDTVSAYGIVDPLSQENDLIQAKGLIEKPARDKAPSCQAIIGRYILPTEIFDPLQKGHIGRGGEIQLTDAMSSLMTTHGFQGFLFKGNRYDCGHHLGWLEANIAEALQRPALSPKLVQSLKILMEFQKNAPAA
ncbi:UTP--glucose-1-phosphate uridylyltransferase [Alphaproteobacteria bacterium]|nr:UTP--glucose-1-phosphate uridylyltransferase [Alphaproteobacteria bacterium]